MEENNQTKVEETEADKNIKEAIEKNIEKVRNTALVHGSKMICSVVLQIIQKHLKKSGKVSLRDYQRMTEEIIRFVSVPLKKENEEKLTDILQNNLEDKQDDGTTEEIN